MKRRSFNTAVKQDAKTLKIKEQTIWRDPSGLTIEFVCIDSTHHPFRVRLYGDCLEFGNRELTFGHDGICNGGGTALGLPECSIIPD